MKKPKNPVFIYSDAYNLDLGPHVFPAVKFGYLYKALREDRRFKKHTFIEPIPVTLDQLETVHKGDYIMDLLNLNNSRRLNRSELPLTKEVVDAFFLATGGSLQAGREALKCGSAVNIGGGFHHAFRNQAEGFCYINDVAVAIRCLIKEKLIEKALVIDLDVHQGNGTARIFRFDRRVFTFSMHEDKNYPVKKERSNLDVTLDTACSDIEYLELLKASLDKIKQSFEPDIIYYLAGVDVFRMDRLGGLSLTKEGIQKRDQMVKDFQPDTPLVMLLAGGYAVHDEDTVALHKQTCEVLAGMKDC